MGYDYSHPQYRLARAQAMERSGGLCQLCGQLQATEGHHWATSYPREAGMTANDLTALCGICHEIATAMRRFTGGRWEFIAKFREVIAQCYTT